MVSTALALVLGLLVGLCGDESKVHLKTGKIVQGTILEETKDFIVLEMEVGQLYLKREAILKIEPVAADPPVEQVEPEPAPKPAQTGPDPAPAAPGGVVPTEPAPSPGASAPDAAEPAIPVAAPPRAPRPRAPRRASRSPFDARLFEGRLLDHYPWLESLSGSTRLLVGGLVWLLALMSFIVGGRMIDIEGMSLGRAAASALIWTILLVGVLLVPSPTLVVGAAVGICLLIAWIVTSRSLLRAGWFQSGVLLVLSTFGLLVLVLLVGVGQSILELN